MKRRVIPCQCFDGCEEYLTISKDEFVRIEANGCYIISKMCENGVGDLYIVEETSEYYVCSGTKPEGEK